MKFLDSKEISVEKGNVKVTFKPVTPVHRTALLGYQVELNNAIEAKDTNWNVQVQMKSAVYALNEMINILEVEGIEYDSKQVASCADTTDLDTFNTLKAIYEISSGLLVEGETKKKSSSQRSRTKKA